MNEHSAEDVAARLGDVTQALSVRDFPAGHGEVGTAGLYAWWVDEPGGAALTATFDTPIAGLIYAGQAGALSSRAGVGRSATLQSRIKGNHLGGNIGSSTFRKTLTACLSIPLGLTLAKSGTLDRDSNQRVSTWMREHLSIVTVSSPDRSMLARLEDEVLGILDPPLNLQGMPMTPVRRRLKELRRGINR